MEYALPSRHPKGERGETKRSLNRPQDGRLVALGVKPSPIDPFADEGVFMVHSLTDACPREAGPWCTRKLHTCADIIPAIESIVGSLESAGYSSKELFAIRLALEEALVNAIKHGHKGDASKEVQLRFHFTPERMIAEIEDQGPGFKPQEVPDPFAPENRERPSGRGLLLMQNYMTWVRFNDSGNRVTMCRQRPSA